MGAFKAKKNNIYINLFSMFVLFFIFIVLSLILVVFATNAYKKMKNQTENTFNSTALIGYITNKIKSCDSDEYSIKIKKEEQLYNEKDISKKDVENKDKKILLLENKDEGFITYIYEKSNCIYENVVKKENKMDENAGQILFTAKDIEFKKINDNLINIKVKTLENETISRYIYIASNVLE